MQKPEQAICFRNVGGWGILLGVPALFVLAWLYPYFRTLEQFPVCAVRHFLGVPCPGCGLTHSLAALMHGNLKASIDAHPLGVVVALWLLYMMCRAAWALFARRWPRELLTQGERDLCLGAFLIALFLQWGVRLATI